MKVTIDPPDSVVSCWTSLPPGTLWEWQEQCVSAVWLRLEDASAAAPENRLRCLMIACAGTRRFVLGNPIEGRSVRVLGRLRLDLPGVDRWIKHPYPYPVELTDD